MRPARYYVDCLARTLKRKGSGLEALEMARVDGYESR